MKKTLTLMGVVALCMATGAQAADIVLTPTADTYNRTDGATAATNSTNYGSAEMLHAHYQPTYFSGGHFSKMFLKFDLTGIDTSALTDVSLSLDLLTSSGLGSESGTLDPNTTVYRMHVYGILDGYAGGADDNLDDGYQGDDDANYPAVNDLGENWSESALNFLNSPAAACNDAGEGPGFGYNGGRRRRRGRPGLRP